MTDGPRHGTSSRVVSWVLNRLTRKRRRSSAEVTSFSGRPNVELGTKDSQVEVRCYPLDVWGDPGWDCIRKGLAELGK